MTTSPFPINQIKILEIEGQKKDVNMSDFHEVARIERERFQVNYPEYVNFYVRPESAQELLRLANDEEIRKLIMDNSRFAIPPFGKMYIVFQTEEIEKERRNGGFIFSIIVTREGEDFTVSPLSVSRDVEEGSENRMFYPNYSLKLTNQEEDKIKLFMKRVAPEHADEQDEILDQVFRRANMMSFVVQLLFLLIYKRPKYLYTVPASHKMVGNKRVAYAAHKTIDLKLFDPKEVISRLAPLGSHASPRRHGVIGHWMHWNVDIHCDHEWDRVIIEEDDSRRKFRENGTEILRHVCKHCGGRRTFRDHFMRGDATKGCFTHDYVA